jgi:hypothetical protein
MGSGIGASAWASDTAPLSSNPTVVVVHRVEVVWRKTSAEKLPALIADPWLLDRNWTEIPAPAALLSR